MAADGVDGFAAFAKEDDPRNWFLVPLAGRKLGAAESGTGGFAEFVGALDNKKIQFCAIKVAAVDEQENVTSKRQKVVRIDWIGPNVSPLGRGAALQNKPHVAAAYQGCQAEIQSDGDMSMLTPKFVCQKLLKAGGAHKPTYYDFGDQQIPLADLYEEA